jgi:hypothetical protein
LALALAAGVMAGGLLARGGEDGPAATTAGSQAGSEPTDTAGSSGESSGGSSSGTAAPAPSGTVVDASCDLPAGADYVGGPGVELVDLGEANGAQVSGAIYPRPDYEGNPWTQWGQGIALADGRFISAIGDHIGPDGNSYVYEYDPGSGSLNMVGDLLSYVEHTPGSWGYGKVHGQMVAGACGEVYFASYWGTNRDLRYGGSYTGDYLFRLDPDRRTIAALDVPIDQHGIPSLAAAPSPGLVYGEAIDPIAEAEDLDAGPFFVYDTVNEEVIFEGDPNQHTGFRNILVDAEGRAYYSVGAGDLAVYDPATNQVSTHPHQMPGLWLRASTTPAPDGRVFAVTRDPDAFFVLHPNGEIEPLGSPAAYTASMAVRPDGSAFYFMPDAHGDAWQFGGALTAVDTSTGEQQVIAELNPLVEQGLGVKLGGTFSIAAAPSGDTIYLGANVGPVGADDGFGDVALLVIDLP